jgi:hypothetical protein
MENRGETMITKIIIDSVQSPTFGGVSFGEVGQYEKLVGRAFGELDPADPLNAVIVDLALAPRNAHGKVEYVVDVYILKPVDPMRGNKVLLFDVTNRGNKMTYLPLNFPFRAPPEFPPVNDPTSAEDAGDGLLIATGDPRPSLEERYGTHSRYVSAVEAAATRLVAERLLRPEDVKAYVEAAQSRELGLPR